MKMKTTILFLICLFCTFTSHAQNDREIDGIIIPKTIKFAEKEMFINGVGIRSKFWSDIYTQALYLTKPSHNAGEIINSDTKMAVIIYIRSTLVTAKNFSKSLEKGLKKTLSDEQVSTFSMQIGLLNELLNQDKIAKNDVFTLIYNDEDKAIWVIKNGVVKGQIPGFEFKKVFFGIWLSENPVNASLKDNLLGQY